MRWRNGKDNESRVRRARLPRVLRLPHTPQGTVSWKEPPVLDAELPKDLRPKG
jgi:hypothetical protein